MRAPQTHTDDRLAAVAAMGYDGVWLHAELRQLAPTRLFERFEPDWAQRIRSLRQVVTRAADHGLGVWLYLCEPRGYPDWHPFWQVHPELRGQPFDQGTNLGWRFAHRRGRSYAMCLSTDAVPRFIEEATGEVFAGTPALAGALVITASEFHTHCYGRLHPAREEMQCPRCADRPAWQMPVEIAARMQAGVQASGSGGRLVFWNWGWDHHIEPHPSATVVNNLPSQAALMSTFEIGDVTRRCGKEIRADEYSFAFTGPSRAFRQQAELCDQQGRDIWAKLQVGVTHELATMPGMPVPGALYDKVAAMRRHGVTGCMAVWTMGLRPVLNNVAAGRLLAHDGDLPPRAQWLADLAGDWFDGRLTRAGVASVVRAWEGFAAALAYHPLEVVFLYHSPMNYAPAYPWRLKRGRTRMARSWTPEPWGDYLEMSCGRLTMEDVALTLDRMAQAWREAMDIYEQALGPLAAASARAAEEIRIAQACGLFFRSCADCYAFAAAADAPRDEAVLLRLIDRELQTCEAVLPLLEADARLGWHDDLQARMADPDRVREKMHLLRQVRDQVV